MLKRLLLVFGMAIVASSSAQITEINVDNAWFTGVINVFPMPNPTAVTSGEGGSTLNLIPVAYAFNRRSNLEQVNGFGTDIAIEQTKIYVGATNQFMPITPRTIIAYSSTVSKAPASDSGTNANEPVAGAKLFNTFTAPPYNSDQYRFGKFRFRILISVNGGAYSSLLTHEFIISPIGLRDANIEGGTDPNSGGITPGDLNDQPVNQEGFWAGVFSTLFIPNPETLDALQAALASWGGWGPFGIINYLNTRINEYSEESQMEYAFSIDLPYAGPTTFDLSPYETFIKIARVLMAMGVWSLFVFGCWKKVYAKV